ncbi:hypothetical protein Trydic_g785 [Trypoxylus dichotomus]
MVLRRRNNTRYVIQHVQRIRSGRITGGFCGWMSATGPGKIVLITGRLTSEQYVDMLQYVFLPSVRILFPEGPIYLVRDNSAIDTARIVKSWFRDNPEIRLIPWPAKSPDFNVIENLWTLMVRNWNDDIANDEFTKECEKSSRRTKAKTRSDQHHPKRRRPLSSHSDPTRAQDRTAYLTALSRTPPVMHMTNICNTILRLQCFPSQWKQADVVMMLKPEQPANWPQNYRPISLFLSWVRSSTESYSESYRRKLTISTLSRTVNSGSARGTPPPTKYCASSSRSKKDFNVQEYTGAEFLDVAKAFHKVWYQGLLLKMHRAGSSKAVVRLVHSYLLQKAFEVKLEGQRCAVRTTTAGVPQGPAISPLLFNIYTSDIPAIAHVNLVTYTDDVGIFARSRNARIADRCFQTALDTLQAWYTK